MFHQRFSSKNKTLLLKVVIHLGAFIPLIYMYYLAIGDQLGGDPVEAIIHFTGIGAFNLLLITLLITPLTKRFKLKMLMNTRRLLGLYAFTYAMLHILNFLFFEVQFNLSLFVEEIFDRAYITVGMLAALCLLALAVTSFSRVKRTMGKSWQTLHNLIYLIVLLVAIHFYWSVKSEIIEPLIYIVITVFLLSLRHHKFKRWFRRAR
ncbi:protein-methionine-sulfoxide reductase heme-binding subunit MsrQ [Colwelliaceae bacterium 6471]